MAQHFLLSSKTRMISSREVAQLSDEEAFDLLCELLWGSRETVVCPKCGVQHKAYWIGTRKQWRCKHYNHTFSVSVRLSNSLSLWFMRTRANKAS